MIGIKKVKVKETTQYYGDFCGTLESIISQLQSELDDGWEGIEEEYERDYGDCHDHKVYYLYKYREETDKEYNTRMKKLEKEKAEKVKAKEKKLNQLKKELCSLSDADKKLLGL